MAPIFKDGAAIQEQALDLARRREFDRAQERFEEAARRFTKEGATFDANLARAYSGLLGLGARGADPTAFRSLSALLRAALGNVELRPGPRGIGAAELAGQLELAAQETALLAALQSGGGDPGAVAQALQALANEYLRLGNQVLFLPELFHQRSIPASSRAPRLMAISFETLGRSKQSTNPLAAAEDFQTAQQYWRQAGEEAQAQSVAGWVGQLALQARCWFCGREGAGHGIQFVSLPVDQELTGLKATEASPLPSLDATGRNVYACKGCWSAFQHLADRIASERANEVERRLLVEMREMERRLRGPTGRA
jgi:hypothetical protein